MSAHTPGPWEVDVNFRWRDGISSGWKEHARVIAQNGDGWTPIAVCRSNAQASDNSANARLIAAAPELLEALRGLLNQSSYSYMSDADLAYEAEAGNQAIPAIQQARAAIAKAAGAQP